MNLRFFILDRVSLASLNMPNDGEFSWRWFLKHCIKGTFCRLVFTSFITRLIRKFYLLIVQLTLMKCIQKCVMHLQCCCFAYSPIVFLFFDVLVAVDLMVHDDNGDGDDNGDDDDGCDDEWFEFCRCEIWLIIASNLQIEIILLITFSGQFACGWI